ncbi:transposase [Candidatus Bipolaricaulota bacterium]|nr:transposase [Candidatus Bipolaricaulota bacterium]
MRKGDRQGVAERLQAVYKAESLEEAEEALKELRVRWGEKYPKVVEKWETKASALLAFLNHPSELRRYLYTNFCAFVRK